MSNDRHALWISHSSISDFLKCPKSYYYKHIYRRPDTNQKITIISPPLALGQAVHNTLESLTSISAERRFQESLLVRFEVEWKQVSGKRGGFHSLNEEEIYKHRGKEMIKRVMEDPGPLKNLAVRLPPPDPSFSLPRFYLSNEQQVILCGKVDWIEYIPADDSIHIIDFKTGKHDEDPSSLQLAIYCLLAQNCQNRTIKKSSYWYLDRENYPTEINMPDCSEATRRLMEIALQMKAARSLGNFCCPRDGCNACYPLIDVVNGNAEYVASNSYQDIFVLS